jgi:glycosyltransferase involved in cell wall biosynthesis
VRIVGGVKGLVRKTRRDLYDDFRELFLGRVTDLAPYYRAARSVIAPMRSGGGISVKTIEAFALGMPFIGTAKAYRGFPSEPLARHGIQSYDDPRAFADALLQVLSAGSDTGKRGRAVYEELFSKEQCYAARDEAMRMAGDIRTPRNCHGASRKLHQRQSPRSRQAT